MILSRLIGTSLFCGRLGYACRARSDKYESESVRRNARSLQTSSTLLTISSYVTPTFFGSDAIIPVFDMVVLLPYSCRAEISRLSLQPSETNSLHHQD